MKWKKSRVGGCYTVISHIINIEVYKSYASNGWVYTLFGHKSVLSYKTMKEAKKAASTYCQYILKKGLEELKKGETK